MSELKACPLCKSRAQLFVHDCRDDDYPHTAFATTIECSNTACCATVTAYHAERQIAEQIVINKWNTRPDDALREAAMKALRWMEEDHNDTHDDYVDCAYCALRAELDAGSGK